MNSKPTVLSLYDYTGVAVKPWADAGVECFCIDNQHTNHTTNNTHFLNFDLHSEEGLQGVVNLMSGRDVIFGFAFPVCTDLAVSGAKLSPRKRLLIQTSRKRLLNMRLIVMQFFVRPTQKRG